MQSIKESEKEAISDGYLHCDARVPFHIIPLLICPLSRTVNAIVY